MYVVCALMLTGWGEVGLRPAAAVSLVKVAEASSWPLAVHRS